MNKYADFSRKAQAERHRWRSCERKQAFATEEQAQHPTMRAYHCDLCDKWHRTGSLMKQVKKAARRK